MKLYTGTYSENHFINPLQRSYSGHFDPKNAYRTSTEAVVSVAEFSPLALSRLNSGTET
jgi:hypothetical protein